MLVREIPGFRQIVLEVVELRTPATPGWSGDELPRAFADGEVARAVGLHDEMIAQWLAVLGAEQGGQQVEAVRASIGGQGLARYGGEGGQHIHQAQQLIGL